MKKETRMAIRYSILFIIIQLIFTNQYNYYGIDFYMAITFLLCRYILKFQSKNRTFLDDIFDIVYGGAILRVGIISTILIYQLLKAKIPFHKRKVYNYFAVELSEPILAILIVIIVGLGLLYFSSLLKKEEKEITTTKKQTIILGTPPKDDRDDIKEIRIERKRNK